jgi:predicted nucleic acid-binding protein
MSFLLDTNVVSEWAKPRPNPGVVAWLAGTNEDQVFLSVVTLAELRHGIERMATGRRQRQLGAWLENEIPMRFEGRVLSIDPAIADACGKLVARSEAEGRPVEAMDAFLAATALVHQLTLVTRNTAHFDSILKALLNPWT